MTDQFVDGVVYACDECGRPVRLCGHNDVVSWTCKPCREGETQTLLDAAGELTETAEYDPARVRIPF